MTKEERLTDASDAIVLYKKYGGSKALRRVAELALRHGTNRVLVSHLEQHDEWDAEIKDIRQRYGFVGYRDQPFRLDFVQRVRGRRPVHVAYALVRPRPNGSLVEALVPPPPEGEASYLTCGCEWDCGLETVPIDADASRLWGTKFVQQDTHSGVCAHACIRSVSMLLNSRFGLDPVTFPEITARAGCRDPREGLTMPQMKRVLRSLGCKLLEFAPGGRGAGDEPEAEAEPTEPRADEAAPDAEAAHRLRPPEVTFWSDEVIYRYTESGLPVLVGIQTSSYAHTFFVVGHAFERESWWPEAAEGYYPRVSREYPWIPSSLWSGSFYIQDDNFGPYMSMTKDICRECVAWVLVPVPEAIGLHLPAEAVEPYVAYLLYDPEIIRLMLTEDNTSEWRSDLRDRQIDRRIVLRTLLVERQSFTDSVLSDECAYPAAVKDVYRQLKLPNWVWLVEVSAAELYGPAVMKLGEALIDPGAPGIRGLKPLLSLHLPGVIWTTPSTDVPRFVDRDRPTTLYTRPTFAQRADQAKRRR